MTTTNRIDPGQALQFGGAVLTLPPRAGSPNAVLSYAENTVTLFGDPDGDPLPVLQQLAYEKALDTGATLAVGEPSLEDWRDSAIEYSHGSPTIRRWLTARENFTDLLRAIWQRNQCRDGNLDLWDLGEGYSNTDHGRQAASDYCENQIADAVAAVVAGAR